MNKTPAISSFLPLHPKFLQLLTICSLLLNVASCSTRGNQISPGADGAPLAYPTLSPIADAVPTVEKPSSMGNPSSYVVAGKRYYVMQSNNGYVQRGIASWYGTKFHGRATSSGETYNMYAMTAAHTRLPIPSYVKVTNLNNKRSIIVRVNDRGPFHANRIIDLSYAAATKLGIVSSGTGVVEVRAIDPEKWSKPPHVAVANTKPVISAKQKTGSNYLLYLQVGAFVSHNNAQQLKDKLTRQFSSVHINSKNTANARLYRVQIGPIATVEEADKLAMRIKKMGYTTLPHVVVN